MTQDPYRMIDEQIEEIERQIAISNPETLPVGELLESLTEIVKALNSRCRMLDRTVGNLLPR